MVPSDSKKLILEDMFFPQYRKYVNGKNFFKIFSPFAFEEVYFIGKKQYRRSFQAKTYTDKMEIRNLLLNDGLLVISIEASEFPG